MILEVYINFKSENCKHIKNPIMISKKEVKTMNTYI